MLGGRARRPLGDPKRLEQILAEAKERAARGSSLEQGFVSFNLITLLIAAYVRDTYREVSYDSTFFVLAAIMYFLFPLDVLSDPIYVDDAAVLMSVGMKVKAEFDTFTS